MCTLQDSNSIFCLKDYKINHKGTYPMWFFVIFGHQTSIILTGTELEKVKKIRNKLLTCKIHAIFINNVILCFKIDWMPWFMYLFFRYKLPSH